MTTNPTPLTAEYIAEQYIDEEEYNIAPFINMVEAYAAQQNAVAEGQVKVTNLLLDRANSYIDELEAENERLKQCPFCGGEAIVNADGWAESSWWFVQCLGCQAQGDEHTSGEKALAAWNTRSTPDLSRILKLAARAYKAEYGFPCYAQYQISKQALTLEDIQLLEAVLKE